MKLTIDTELTKPVVVLGLNENKSRTVSHFLSRDIEEVEIILNSVPGFVNTTLDAINESFSRSVKIDSNILADQKIRKTMLIIRQLLRNLVKEYGSEVIDEKVFGKKDQTPDWVKEFLKGVIK